MKQRLLRLYELKASMPDSFGLGDPPVDEEIVRLNGVAKPKAKFGYL